MVKKSITGFTLLELLFVVAIISILASAAIPGMGDMLKEYKLRSATRDIFSNLQELKLRAIKENARTLMLIDENNDTYTIFVDDNPVNWVLDGPEFISVTDVSKDGLEISSNFLNDTLGFNSRGLPATGIGGTIIITRSGGVAKQVIINTAGNIRVD